MRITIVQQFGADPRMGTSERRTDAYRFRLGLFGACLLSAFVCAPVLASSTACVFSGEAGRDYYEIEFIGYSDIDPLIVLRSRARDNGAGVSLDSRHYRLKEFSQQARRVRLEFDNPGQRSLPPSFVLEGAAGKASLSIGGRRVDGTLECGY